MSRSGRRAGLAASAALGTVVLGLVAGPAVAIGRGSPATPIAVLVVGVPEVSLTGLVVAPTVRAVVGASSGGAALMVATGGAPIDELNAEGSSLQEVRLRDAGELRSVLSAFLDDVDGSASALILIYTTPPAGDPRWLGSVASAEGNAGAMREALTERGNLPVIDHTLTSDSTHRAGVVTAADVATTAISASAVTPDEDPAGSRIRVVDGPPPVGLYERYLDQRRLVVPIGLVAGLYALVAALLGLILLFGRAGSAEVRSVAGWAAISVVPLAASLMLVGHLERLTFATVIAFLTAITILAILAMVPIQRARGLLASIAALGVGLLGMFVVEAYLGWTATLTPLLGGAQLDGGRFFGLPNVQIGLLMGASIYVAQRIRSAGAGVGLVLAAALFAGLPWTGSNIGAAVTIAAAAGIWWGLRADGGRLRPMTIVRVLVAVAGTVVVVVVAHRYLTDTPTHISRFASDTGGLGGLWQKFVDRLEVGADLIARNPLGLIPVLGTLATLWLVLRPPSALRPSLTAHPAWRDGLVTILVGSLIAYVANDSGAAAIGLGFGTALGGLLYVSLADAPAKMEAS